MKNSTRLCVRKAIGLTCVLGSAVAVTAPASVARADPTVIFTAVGDAIGAVKTYYDTINWLDCNVGLPNPCPETDAQAAADRAIISIGTLDEKIDVDHMIGAFRALNVRANRDYTGGPPLPDEESSLLDDAEKLFFDMDTKLSDTNATDQVQVDAAYKLAPFYNMQAALLDHIARTALARGVAKMNEDTLNFYRSTTFLTDYKLVGAQSAWFQCPGATMVDTTQSDQDLFATKILWRDFANYKYEDHVFESLGDGFCANDCNVFNRATSPGGQMCTRDCNSFPYICSACVVGGNEEHYPYEVAKILPKMNRDGAVRVIRAAMEKLVAMGPMHGTGVLWFQPSGELDLSVLSTSAYKAFPLGQPDPTVWSPIGTGDFDGDGDSDVLWRDTRDGLLSIWMLSGTHVTQMTPGTANMPSFGFDNWGVPFIGDLDGDGVSDIVWAAGTPSWPQSYYNLVWLMNPGTSTPKSTIYTTSPTDIAQGVGVFNLAGEEPGPGPNDHPYAEIVYRSQITGEVSIADIYGTRESLGNVGFDWVIEATGKLNADQTTEILWYNTITGDVSIWAVRGYQYIWTTIVGNVPPADGWTPKALADVDNDGIDDIVWQNANSLTPTTVWMMNGSGYVREYGQALGSNSNARFAGVVHMGPPAPANAPLPTLPDTYCGVSNGQLRIPAFANYETWFRSAFEGGNGTMSGDIDGDGKADLVTLGASYVNAVRSTGGSFGALETALPTSFWGSHGTFLGDVDGDGRADLVALGDTNIAVRKSNQRNAASFGGSETWWTNLFDGGYGTMLGDIDGDGMADLVGIGAGYVGVLRSKGNTFGAYETGHAGPFWGPHGTFLADVDGDGKADLVALCDGYIPVRRATAGVNGQELFGAEETWATDTFYGTHRSFVGDVDGDGRADLVGIYDDHVSVRRSLGTSFGDVEIWFGGTFNGNTFLADVDGNTRADLVGIGSAGSAQLIDVIRSQ